MSVYDFWFALQLIRGDAPGCSPVCIPYSPQNRLLHWVLTSKPVRQVSLYPFYKRGPGAQEDCRAHQCRSWDVKVDPCASKPRALHYSLLVGNPHSQTRAINMKFWSNHRKNCKEPKPTFFFLFFFLLSYPSVAAEARDELLREDRSREVRPPTTITHGSSVLSPCVHSSPSTTFPFTVPHAMDLVPNYDHPVMNLMQRSHMDRIGHRKMTSEIEPVQRGEP